MFERKQYDLTKAEINEQFNNAHINFGFHRSPDDKDQELNNLNLDSNENISKLESVDSNLPSELVSPSESKSPFKNRLSLRSNSSNKEKLTRNDNSFERGESILFERKSMTPELETAIKWNDLTVNINVKGKSKKILDNVCGEVNNLEIMVNCLFFIYIILLTFFLFEF